MALSSLVRRPAFSCSPASSSIEAASSVASIASSVPAEPFPAAYGVRGTDIYVVFATTHFSGYALASGMFRIDVDFPFRLPDFDR